MHKTLGSMGSTVKKNFNTTDKISKCYLPGTMLIFLKIIKDDKDGKWAWQDSSVGKSACCASLLT